MSCFTAERKLYFPDVTFQMLSYADFSQPYFDTINCIEWTLFCSKSALTKGNGSILSRLVRQAGHTCNTVMSGIIKLTVSTVNLNSFSRLFISAHFEVLPDKLGYPQICFEHWNDFILPSIVYCLIFAHAPDRIWQVPFWNPSVWSIAISKLIQTPQPFSNTIVSTQGTLMYEGLIL